MQNETNGIRSGDGRQCNEVQDIARRNAAQQYIRGKSRVEASGCWNWLGSTSITGYGRCKCFGEQRAHRVSYAAFKGPIGNGFILHSCDNPKCVNPEHLRLGSHADNARDRAIRNRHGKQKLTPVQVLEIRTRTDVSGHQLAAIYGVDNKAIRQIKKGETWKHL